MQRLEGAPMLGGKRPHRPKSSRHRDQCRRWPAGKGWATSKLGNKTKTTVTLLTSCLWDTMNQPYGVLLPVKGSQGYPQARSIVRSTRNVPRRVRRWRQLTCRVARQGIHPTAGAPHLVVAHHRVHRRHPRRGHGGPGCIPSAGARSSRGVRRAAHRDAEHHRRAR